MVVITQKMIYRSDLRKNPKVLYLFGDNEDRRGLGGQAKNMRGEPNARGVATKLAPGTDPDDYWTDKSLERNCVIIDADLKPAVDLILCGGVVVIPQDGLGTGLSKLPQYAPKTFKHLNDRIAELYTLAGQLAADHAHS